MRSSDISTVCNRCSSKVDVGYKTCVVCREYSRKRGQRDRKVRNKTGLCRWCPKKAAKGKRLCSKCLIRSRAYRLKRNRKFKKERRCAKCGSRDLMRGRKTCNKCNDYALKKQKERFKKGLCCSCGRKARPGKWSCFRCFRKMTPVYKRYKEDVVAAYGGKCACCGVSEISFLCVDHIKRDGSKERKRLGTSGAGPAFYRRLKKLGYPKRYQVLCMNCNFSRHLLGECAHRGN